MDLRKVVQAAQTLLNIHGGKMPYIKLVKLLYIADRIAMEHNLPAISGDRYVAMKHGPVLSNLLALISSIAEIDSDRQKMRVPAKKDHCDLWEASFAMKDAYTISAKNDAEAVSDALSEGELQIVEDTGNFFKDWGHWKVVEFTHKECPEWVDPHPFGVQDLHDFEILWMIEKGKTLAPLRGEKYKPANYSF